MTSLLGRKLGMTQVFDEIGNQVPVTVIEAGPCPIVQVKTRERDGYAAVQLGFGPERAKRVSRPRKGHFDAAGVDPTHHLREFPLPEAAEGRAVEVGQVVGVGIFQRGDLVKVVGTTRGKGFQGGVKRHGWRGGPETHGSMFHRAPGSMGASSYPSRVVPGHPLPGHMGKERMTVRNLQVVSVIPDRNLILVKGAVPGPKNGLLEIHLTARAQGAEAKAGE
ncbi:MAG: 50S ribosomal protein L3 [Candidatus Tectomicrobia bacterium]|nr:50S ribosomal protein L3 [Candidatus Tectomicrobia bacterium]